MMIHTSIDIISLLSNHPVAFVRKKAWVERGKPDIISIRKPVKVNPFFALGKDGEEREKTKDC